MPSTAALGAALVTAPTVFALFSLPRVRVASGEGAYRLRVNVPELELFDPFALS